MLVLKQVTKQFDGKTVLDHINLEVRKGSIALLLGSSGVGKSTVLRVLCGLETIDSGTITLDGTLLTQASHHIGMVFQQFNLFSHLTVIENITLPLEKVLGYSHKTAQLLALELLHKYGLADKATLCVKRLSGGQKQRVALIRALVLKPDVICFDEPTSALDPILTTQVAETIAQLAHDGFTILVTTHDTMLVEKLPCTVHLMKKGVIVESAPSYNYLQDPDRWRQINSFIKGHQTEAEKTENK